MTLAVVAFFLFLVMTLGGSAFLKLTEAKQTNNNVKTYLNEDYASDDPLLTQVPKLEDILRGPIISNADPVIGPAEAKVNITLFTNFGCKFCGEVMQTVQKVQAQFPNQVKIIHKDFPSANKAYATYQAAIAGRCAQAQGMFFAISEKLYENYQNLTPDVFKNLANNLGLNNDKFSECLNGQTATPTTQLIDDNIAEAHALQIIGIPLLYVNDKELLGDVSYEELKQIVEEQLETQE